MTRPRFGIVSSLIVGKTRRLDAAYNLAVAGEMQRLGAPTTNERIQTAIASLIRRDQCLQRRAQKIRSQANSLNELARSLESNIALTKTRR